MDDDGSTPTVGESLTRHLRRIVVSTGVVTAVAYVFIRVACSVFYGPLGLAPEDVGIGSSELLARAAGIVALVLVFAVVLAAPVLEVHGLVRSNQDERFIWPGWVVGVWAAIVVAAFVVAPDAGALAVLAGAVTSGAVRVLSRPPSPHLARWLTVLGLSVAALSTGTVYGAAVWDRERVVDGKGLQGFERTLFPWEATVAEIYWTGASPAPEAIADLQCGVYLGTDGSTAVVVDTRGKPATVLRLPASDVTIRTHFDTTDGEPVCRPSGIVESEP